MNAERALFDSFNARFLQPAQIAKHFVVPSHFEQVCERNHSVIVGPRGSGKTTLLKMLQIPALKMWGPELRERGLDQIDFTSVYVAADNSWISLFSDTEDFKIPTEFQEILSHAVFLVYLQFSFLDAIEQVSDESILKDDSLSRFYIPRTTVENDMSSRLSDIWIVNGTSPTYFVLRAKLGHRLNEIATISDAVKFGGISSAAHALEKHPFLSLKYEFLIRNTIDIINSTIGDPDRKWAICFDELEIVPETLRQRLYRNLRSTDQRILFKMSLSPFSIDAFYRGDANNPMPGQDYTEISLTYPRSADAMRFGRELLRSLLREAGLADTAPEQIFGVSSVAAAESLGREPISAYQAPDGERYKLISELRDLDPTFKRYLRDRRYDIESMPSMKESKRAEIRKLLQICRVRTEFRNFLHLATELSDRRAGFRRSRKRIHQMYTGIESLLTLCEGNPRWVIGILRPQVIKFARDRKRGYNSPLDRAYQARQILKVIGRYRALLGTIPLKGRQGSRASVLQLIDKIGQYMFKDVVLGPFKPEPVLSFIVDSGASAAQIQALGTAVNQGAFISVPNRKGDTAWGTIVNSRFRLSYLLAPDFQLPLTYGAQVNLSTILNERPLPGQMRLEDV